MHHSFAVISGEQAARYLQEWAYSGQRALDRSKVEQYIVSIRRGDINRLEIGLAYLDGRELLVDGQHRLHALAQIQARDGHNHLSLRASIIRHLCHDTSDVGRLFATFDRNKVRTPGQIYDAMGVPESLGLTKYDVKFFSQAMPLLANHFASGYVPTSADFSASSPQARSEMMEEWALEAVAYFQALRGTASEVRGLLTRAAVVAVALVTFRHQEPRAAEFWRQVADGSGLRHGDPAFTLLSFLRANTSKKGAPWLYARYVTAAWNASYRGERLLRLQVRDPHVPILILGTPYGENNRKIVDNPRALGVRRRRRAIEAAQ
jgi:hypothetical protein